MLREESGRNYDNYGTIGRDLMPTAPEGGRKISALELDRIQRERMTKVLDKVVHALEQVHRNYYGDALEESGSTGEVQMSTVVTGPHGQRITAAVVGIAKKVEDNVKKVVTAAASAKSPHGAATIK